MLALIVYVLLGQFIHKVNKKEGAFQYIIYFVEYVIFGIGMIPMISRFVEVQICNDNLKITNWTSIKCFEHDQLLILQIGFICIAIIFILNAVIFPTLNFERNSVDMLYGEESYIEGYYYLILIGVVSLLCYIRLPWVGIFLCGVVLAYALVFDCYESLFIACSRCGVLGAFMWAFSAAYILDNDNDHDAGNTMIKLTAIGYFLGYVTKAVRGAIIKKEKKNTVFIPKFVS